MRIAGKRGSHRSNSSFLISHFSFIRFTAIDKRCNNYTGRYDKVEPMKLYEQWLRDFADDQETVQDLLAINGFDENYTLPATGEDYDIEWRMKAIGCKIVSLRNLAVQYHLYHPENWNDQSVNAAYCREKQQRNEIYCPNGIRKA